MSDLEVISGIDTQLRILEDMVDSLPTYFPKHDESPNYKLLGPVARQINDMQEGLDDLEKNVRPDEVDSIEGLRKIAQIVNINPRTNEDLEHYRVRVLTELRNVTNEGTIGDLVETISFILDINSQRIQYLSSDEPGLILIGIPQSSINNSPIDNDELIEIINNNVAAGYQVESLVTGTLTFLSEEDDPEEDSDPDLGYTGLDDDGEPKDNGGTYSTVLE